MVWYAGGALISQPHPRDIEIKFPKRREPVRTGGASAAVRCAPRRYSRRYRSAVVFKLGIRLTYEYEIRSIREGLQNNQDLVYTRWIRVNVHTALHMACPCARCGMCATVPCPCAMWVCGSTRSFFDFVLLLADLGAGWGCSVE